MKPEAFVIKTSDTVGSCSLLMNKGKTDDSKAMTPLTSRSCLCAILMRHKLIYRAFNLLCGDNSVTSETPANTERVVTV